jgi:hypothetical protein
MLLFVRFCSLTLLPWIVLTTAARADDVERGQEALNGAPAPNSQAMPQRQAIEAIINVGGCVTFEREDDRKPVVSVDLSRRTVP